MREGVPLRRVHLPEQDGVRDCRDVRAEPERVRELEISRDAIHTREVHALRPAEAVYGLRAVPDEENLFSASALILDPRDLARRAILGLVDEDRPGGHLAVLQLNLLHDPIVRPKAAFRQPRPVEIHPHLSPQSFGALAVEFCGLFFLRFVRKTLFFCPGAALGVQDGGIVALAEPPVFEPLDLVVRRLHETHHRLPDEKRAAPSCVVLHQVLRHPLVEPVDVVAEGLEDVLGHLLFRLQRYFTVTILFVEAHEAVRLRVKRAAHDVSVQPVLRLRLRRLIEHQVGHLSVAQVLEQPSRDVL